MKKILYLFFGILFLSSSSLFYMTDVYTKNEINDLITGIYNDYEYDYRYGNIKNISLGDLLIENYTIKQWSRHDKWLSKIKSNPFFFHKMLENYGEYGLNEINLKLENNSSINAKEFWESHESDFTRYMNLIDLLLSLEEDRLNALVSSSEGMFDYYNTTEKEKIRSFLDENNIMYCNQKKRNTEYKKNQFPHDLLSLTRRVSDKRDWSEKKFLNQVKIIGEELSQTAKKKGYFSSSFPIPIWEREYYDDQKIKSEIKRCNCCKDKVMIKNTYYKNGSIKSHWSCDNYCENQNLNNCREQKCWNENGKRKKCEDLGVKSMK